MNIIELTGHDLKTLLEELAHKPEDIRIVRVAIDGGSFKFKVNEYTWSPPLGTQRKR